MVGKGVGERKLYTVGTLSPPVHCMPCPVVCLVAWVWSPLSCSPQLMQLPSLHRPRHPPASRPHGPESRHSHSCATHTVRSQPDISLPHPPWISRFQEQPSPHHWDPSPAWRVHHYVRKAPPAPPKPPPCLSEACTFILDYSRTSVEKMFLMSGREDRMGMLPSKEGLGEVFIQGSN